MEVEDAAAVFAGHQHGLGAKLLPELQTDLHEAALALGVDGFDGDDAIFMLLAEAFVEAGDLGRQRGEGGFPLFSEGGYFDQTGLVTGEGLLAGGLEVFLHGEQRLFGRAEFRAELLFFHQQFKLALFGFGDGLFGPVDFVFEGAGLGQVLGFVQLLLQLDDFAFVQFDGAFEGAAFGFAGFEARFERGDGFGLGGGFFLQRVEALGQFGEFGFKAGDRVIPVLQPDQRLHFG